MGVNRGRLRCHGTHPFPRPSAVRACVSPYHPHRTGRSWLAFSKVSCAVPGSIGVSGRSGKAPSSTRSYVAVSCRSCSSISVSIGIAANDGYTDDTDPKHRREEAGPSPDGHRERPPLVGFGLGLPVKGMQHALSRYGRGHSIHALVLRLLFLAAVFRCPLAVFFFAAPFCAC